LKVTGLPGLIDGVLGSLEGVGARLDGEVDRSLSVALAGTAETLVPITGDAVCVQYLRGRVGASSQLVHDRWRIRHSEIVMKTEGLRGYLQNHAVEVYSKRLADLAGVGAYDIDGVEEIYAADSAELAHVRRSVLNEMATRERRFLDIVEVASDDYRWAVGREPGG
jgi:hypothetical protein